MIETVQAIIQDINFLPQIQVLYTDRESLFRNLPSLHFAEEDNIQVTLASTNAYSNKVIERSFRTLKDIIRTRKRYDPCTFLLKAYSWYLSCIFYLSIPSREFPLRETSGMLLKAAKGKEQYAQLLVSLLLLRIGRSFSTSYYPKRKAKKTRKGYRVYPFGPLTRKKLFHEKGL